MTLEKRTSTMKDKKQAPSYKSVHILTQKVNSPNTDCEISMMIRMRSSASIHGNERVICWNKVTEVIDDKQNNRRNRWHPFSFLGFEVSCRCRYFFLDYLCIAGWDWRCVGRCHATLLERNDCPMNHPLSIPFIARFSTQQLLGGLEIRHERQNGFRAMVAPICWIGECWVWRPSIDQSACSLWVAFFQCLCMRQSIECMNPLIGWRSKTAPLSRRVERKIPLLKFVSTRQMTWITMILRPCISSSVLPTGVDVCYDHVNLKTYRF